MKRLFSALYTNAEEITESVENIAATVDTSEYKQVDHESMRPPLLTVLDEEAKANADHFKGLVSPITKAPMSPSSYRRMSTLPGTPLAAGGTPLPGDFASPGIKSKSKAFSFEKTPKVASIHAVLKGNIIPEQPEAETGNLQPEKKEPPWYDFLFF